MKYPRLTDRLMARAAVALEHLRCDGAGRCGLVLGAGDELFDVIDLVGEGSRGVRGVCSFGGCRERGVAEGAAAGSGGRGRGLLVHAAVLSRERVWMGMHALDVTKSRWIGCSLVYLWYPICPSQWQMVSKPVADRTMPLISGDRSATNRRIHEHCKEKTASRRKGSPDAVAAVVCLSDDHRQGFSDQVRKSKNIPSLKCPY